MPAAAVVAAAVVAAAVAAAESIASFTDEIADSFAVGFAVVVAVAVPAHATKDNDITRTSAKAKSLFMLFLLHFYAKYCFPFSIF